MAFKKGDPNINREGRKVGSINKSTEEIKQTINKIVSSQLDSLEKDLSKLRKSNPEEAIRLSLRLLEYILPKMTKMDLTGEVKHTIDKITIEIKNGIDNKDD